MDKNFDILILAAGNSRRLKSNFSKMLLKIGKYTLIEIAVKLAKKLKPRSINILVNKKLIYIEEQFKSCNFFIQKKQLGTGHAVKVFLKKTNKKINKLLVLYGDTPLIKHKDIMLLKKKSLNSDLTILAFKDNKNKSCGIIKKDLKNKIQAIVEFKNATRKEKKIKLCNSGIMIINKKIFPLISSIKKNHFSNEYYLTEIIETTIKRKFTVEMVVSSNKIGSKGINDLKTYNKNLRYFKKNYS